MSACRACPPPNRSSSSANIRPWPGTAPRPTSRCARRARAPHLAPRRDRPASAARRHSTLAGRPCRAGTAQRRPGRRPTARDVPHGADLACPGSHVSIEGRGGQRRRPASRGQVPARGAPQRQAHPVGEFLERGHGLRFALARDPLAEPPWGMPGQLGYLALGQPSGAEAEMTVPRSRLAHASRTSGRAQTRSTIDRTSAMLLTAMARSRSLGRSP